MLAITSGIIAVIFYALGTYFQSQSLLHERDNRGKVVICGGIAILAHFISMTQVITAASGYDFSFFRTATLFSFTMSATIFLSALKKPLENLFLGIFPLAIICILASLFLPVTTSPQADYPPGVALHIVLAILATSIITIGAFQAGFMAYQNYQLRHKHAFGWVSHLPPLQTMESLLFEILWVGIVLLTAVLVTGFLFMENFFGQHLSHKTVLSIISWFVFAILLWGRHQLGWRGSTAIRWTLTGFVFLILSYFGSKFVLELILNRV